MRSSELLLETDRKPPERKMSSVSMEKCHSEIPGNEYCVDVGQLNRITEFNHRIRFGNDRLT